MKISQKNILFVTVLVVISLIYQSCMQSTEKQTFYYPDGSIKEIGYYDIITGEQTGVWQTYDKRGKLLTEKNYSGDMLDGESKCFYPNGNLKSVEVFQKGLLLSIVEFYPSGNKKIEGGYMPFYHENQRLQARKGKWFYYSDKESVDSIVHYKAIEGVKFEIDISHGIIDSVLRIYYQKERTTP